MEKIDHGRRWAGRWSICKESFKLFFSAKKSEQVNNFVSLLFVVLFCFMRVFRSERTLLEARSQKHMKALFMFLQKMCSLGKGKTEGNYETAIIDKTSTQQKLEHGQRWIWHPRSRADRIEAQKIHNLFPNYHYMFVILYYCILHFSQRTLKLNCCVIVLRDSCSRISIWGIHQPEDKTTNQRRFKQPKWPPFHGISWILRPGTIWRIYWLYPPLPLPQSWRHVEDLDGGKCMTKEEFVRMYKRTLKTKTQCEKLWCWFMFFQWYYWMLIFTCRWHWPEIWVCVMRDARCLSCRYDWRNSSAACVHQPMFILHLNSKHGAMSQVTMTTQLSKNVTLNSPLVAAPMDTVTEAVLCQCPLQSKCHEYV